MYAPILILCTIFLISPWVAPAEAQISLDGEWLFVADSAHAGLKEQWYEPSHDRSGWQVVAVPSVWERYPGLEQYDGWGWYAKTVTVPKGGPSRLSFDGVDDNAVNWVNGRMLGSHTVRQNPI